MYGIQTQEKIRATDTDIWKNTLSQCNYSYTALSPTILSMHQFPFEVLTLKLNKQLFVERHLISKAVILNKQGK